jgi:hypothetical protein
LPHSQPWMTCRVSWEGIGTCLQPPCMTTLSGWSDVCRLRRRGACVPGAELSSSDLNTYVTTKRRAGSLAPERVCIPQSMFCVLFSCVLGSRYPRYQGMGCPLMKQRSQATGSVETSNSTQAPAAGRNIQTTGKPPIARPWHRQLYPWYWGACFVSPPLASHPAPGQKTRARQRPHDRPHREGALGAVTKPAHWSWDNVYICVEALKCTYTQT